MDGGSQCRWRVLWRRGLNQSIRHAAYRSLTAAARRRAGAALGRSAGRVGADVRSEAERGGAGPWGRSGARQRLGAGDARRRAAKTTAAASGGAGAARFPDPAANELVRDEAPGGRGASARRCTGRGAAAFGSEGCATAFGSEGCATAHRLFPCTAAGCVCAIKVL